MYTNFVYVYTKLVCVGIKPKKYTYTKFVYVHTKFVYVYTKFIYVHIKKPKKLKEDMERNKNRKKKRA